MKHLYSSILSVLVFCSVIQCSSSQDRPLPFREKISPNHCRITGTILSIDDTFRTVNPKDPCSRAPCLAIVRIDKVHGYGSAFNKPLAVGNEITVLFKFSLSPTQNIVPNLERHYPGLSAGSSFQADMESPPETLQKEEKTIKNPYIIYGYHVIEK